MHILLDINILKEHNGSSFIFTLKNIYKTFLERREPSRLVQSISHSLSDADSLMCLVYQDLFNQSVIHSLMQIV